MYTGSIFRKWDLHVHTPASFENQYRFDTGESEQYGDEIWEKYISKLEEIKDICAICVTDYFSLDGYKITQEYRARGRLNNFTLLLPNIEFRLDKFVGKDNRSINYHVIFSNELSAELIEKEFLEDVKFEITGGEKRRLDRKNITEFGKMIKALAPGRET